MRLKLIHDYLTLFSVQNEATILKQSKTSDWIGDIESDDHGDILCLLCGSLKAAASFGGGHCY